jgi:enoyl-[acyl-carrier protein] reductase II
VNKLCDLLGILYPIIQGGMGNVSNASLTAAVSNAGGLGTLGVGTMKPDEIEEKIKGSLLSSKKPFAINIPLSVTPYVKEAAELVFKYKIPVVTLSAGNPEPFITKFKEKGIKVICVVASVKHAKKAQAAGADIIVAEGYEAAGINSTLELTTMTLIPQIVDAVNIPVVAAGGIGDGRGLLAALALGASGVQLGTRLIATKEGEFHQDYKEKIIEANDLDTIIVGRKFGKIRRLLNTPYSTKLLADEQDGLSSDEFIERTTEAKHIKGAIQGDLDEGFINGGQIAGLIKDIPIVEELFKSMIQESQTRISFLNKTFSK